MNATPDSPKRWYREPFVWLLIAFPLTAVIGGFVTLALAIQSDDGVVEDDYYHRGKEINRVLARDQAAARQGLAGDVALDAAAQELRLSLSARDPKAVPAQVELQFLHATRAGMDRTLLLARGSDGIYRAGLPVLTPGHWHVQVSTADWRLVGSLQAPRDASAVLRPGTP